MSPFELSIGGKERREFSPAPSREAGRPEGQNLEALVAPCELLLLIRTEMDKKLLYMLKGGLYYTLGYKREIRFLLVAPRRLRPRVTSLERMFPLVLGAEFLHRSLFGPSGDPPWLPLVGSQRILHPPRDGLVLINEAVLPMTQRPLFTTPIQKERG